MKKCRSLVSISLLLGMILFLFSSCGSESQDSAYEADYGYWETTAASTYAVPYAAYDADVVAYADSYEGGMYSSKSEAAYKYTAEAEAPKQTSSVADTRKIIRTENLSLETKAFDETVAGITKTVEKLGGYIESSNISGQSMESHAVARYASFTIRVPAAALDEYVDFVSENYYVTSHTTDASDITDRYYDTEARMNSLLTQEERLLSMLEGATDLEYMLKLEDKLSEIRYQIESYYSTLSRYDKQVALSTVYISLQEVMEYQPVVTLPQTFGERFSKAVKISWQNFGESMQDFAIDFMYSLPGLLLFLIIVGIIVLIIWLLVRRSRRIRKQKAEKLAKQQEQIAQLRQNDHTV